MWEHLDQGLAESGMIGDHRPTVVIKDGVDGATMRASILLEQYKFDKILGEPTSLRITVADSHNQTVKRIVKAMLYRLSCLNGQSSVSENIQYAQKHTVGSSPEKLGDVAATWPAKLLKEAELQATMKHIPVKDEKVVEFFENTVATTSGMLGKKVNVSALKDAMTIWHGYENVGNNVFRVYNTLTHIGTHVEVKAEGANLHRKIAREEQRIEEILRGPDFQGLMVAA